jgi:PhzF family phenazine biosynthesis protein
MRIKLFQVDAFTNRVFCGNPAAVCVLDEWLDDLLMQQIAAENNLSETAFSVKHDNAYEIRWFTPNSEVDLCGHATLATAHVLFNHYGLAGEKIVFHTKERGTLGVIREGDFLTLDFPADPPEKIDEPQKLIDAIGKTPVESYRGRSDYLLIYHTQRDIEAITPDFVRLTEVDLRGIIVSAPGDDNDFVSRFFAPKLEINEDPVTGSAHTTLTPFWSERLGKNAMTARQLSNRKGDLQCKLIGSRVHITGQAVTYLVGEIEI